MRQAESEGEKSRWGRRMKSGKAEYAEGERKQRQTGNEVRFGGGNRDPLERRIV